MNQIKSITLKASALLTVILLTLTPTQAQSPASKLSDDGLSGRSEFRLDAFRFLATRQSLKLRQAGFSLMPEASASISASAMTPMAAGPNLTVLGGGTLGRLTKWTGFTSSNSFIGNSTIFENKEGLVGIGTDTPTSKLTVAGMIQTTMGGFKFPDGTVQTTSAAGALFSVAHDATLQGNGTAGTPLGVATPLVLTGSIETGNILTVVNDGFGGRGVFASGGAEGAGTPGGNGVSASGGAGTGLGGGHGLDATGGSDPEGGVGGFGVNARGGEALLVGGAGVNAVGGLSPLGDGGTGVFARGGSGSGASNSGGSGIKAFGGTGLGGATDGLAGEFIGNVQVSGNILVPVGGKGIVLTSPDGATCRLLSIDNAGNIVLTAISCP